MARSRARFRVLVCGRRWGKTRLGVVEALAVALRGGRVWWVAPVYSQALIAWRLLGPMARQIPGAVPRESEHVLRLPGGGEVWCKSADRPDALRGEGLDLLVMDEADFVDEAVWTESLRATLSDRKGRALFISSPRIEGGWFHRLYLEGQRPGDVQSWSFPSVTNPHLDPAEIDAARRQLPSIVFRREYEADFVSASGARIQRAWLRTAPPPAGLDLVMGVDLAISTRDGADWTAAAVIGRSPDGLIYVVDVQRGRFAFDGVMRFVEAMASKWSPRIVAVEAVAYQLAAVQELTRTTTLPVVPVRPDRDKLSRFQPLEARYEQGLVRHAPGLSADFERELLGFPVGEHDDQVDALSCAWAALSTHAPSYRDARAGLRRGDPSPAADDDAPAELLASVRERTRAARHDRDHASRSDRW